MATQLDCQTVKAIPITFKSFICSNGNQMQNLCGFLNSWALLPIHTDIFVATFHRLLCICAGFDLCEVGQEEVVLKTGKMANRRTLHFALQSLLALFGKYILCCWLLRKQNAHAHL